MTCVSILPKDLLKIVDEYNDSYTFNFWCHNYVCDNFGESLKVCVECRYNKIPKIICKGCNYFMRRISKVGKRVQLCNVNGVCEM